MVLKIQQRVLPYLYPIANATLPGVDNSYQNQDEDRKTQQNCQTPPCPPAEMCIQASPESLP